MTTTQLQVDIDLQAYLDWLEPQIWETPYQTGLTALDLFCGSGGSSDGMRRVGVEVKHAANHWQLAIDVHRLNHPGTDHSRADISDSNPWFFPSTDILWASPECTNYSIANRRNRVNAQRQLDQNGDAVTQERSRVLMDDVPRFMDYARRIREKPYKYVVVENVVEVAGWEKFGDWTRSIRNLGYDYQVVSLNSMFAHGPNYVGTPQSRDRLYVVCWDSASGVAAPDLDIRPPAKCEECDEVVNAVQVWRNPRVRVGRYRAQYDYKCPSARCGSVVHPFALPAWTALDFEQPGHRISARKRAFVDNSADRVYGGLARYGAPVLIDGSSQRNDPGRTTAWQVPGSRGSDDGRSLLVPAISSSDRSFSARSGPGDPNAISNLRSMIESLPAGSVMPLRVSRDVVAIPGGFMVRNYKARNDPAQMTSPLSEPARTVTGQGNQTVVFVPWDEVARQGDVMKTICSSQAPLARSRELFDSSFARALLPEESKRLMGFPRSYQAKGHKKDQFQMHGQAVTPPAASLLMDRCVAAHFPEVATDRNLGRSLASLF